MLRVDLKSLEYVTAWARASWLQRQQVHRKAHSWWFLRSTKTRPCSTQTSGLDTFAWESRDLLWPHLIRASNLVLGGKNVLDQRASVSSTSIGSTAFNFNE